jgi:phospholipase C
LIVEFHKRKYMKKIWLFKFAAAFALVLSACGTSLPTSTPAKITMPAPTNTSLPSTQSVGVSAATPCIGAPAPSQWQHVVVLMFENKTYDEVIGVAPYITSLANKCGTSINWNDADYKVDGSADGDYNSKPSYATITNGLSPSAHGLIDDDYAAKTKVDNIYNQLNLAGKSFKDYYDSAPDGCGVEFNGDYHDPIRFYTNVASICDAHDVPLSTFMTDVNNGNLPVFSMILPANNQNMHNNSIASGDAYARTILDPLLDSQAYAKGDVAIFFLWDEDSPIPNVLIAPSVIPGSKVSVPPGNPVSHFSALRTWEEMLALPLLGDTSKAPSLLPFFGTP